MRKLSSNPLFCENGPFFMTDTSYSFSVVVVIILVNCGSSSIIIFSMAGVLTVRQEYQVLQLLRRMDLLGCNDQELALG